MSIKIFVRYNEQGQELPASKSHESWGAYDLIRRLWKAFHPLKASYAIGINLEFPSADLVIVSERGLGVVELKDYSGEIEEKIPNGAWVYKKSDKVRIIKGGKKKGLSHVNPHQQVYGYAEIIRQKSQGYLSGCTSRNARDFIFNTAVCFTHPTANIGKLQHAYQSHEWPHKPKERIQIINPKDIVQWVHTLSFDDETQTAGGRRYKRTSLNPNQVFTFFEKTFEQVRESVEIPRAMEAEQPPAYITLKKGNKHIQSVGVYPGMNNIGRDPNAQVPIPMEYVAVSREHARILYANGKAAIQDSGSKYGTFIGTQRVPTEGSIPLDDGQIITLCRSNQKDEFACVLHFGKTAVTVPSTLTIFRDDQS